MAQHDYVIANGTGAAVRSDLNNALAAIVSNNSGATEPATMYAYQWWADTTTGLLKLRNAANNAWITLRELDGTLTIEDGTASSPGLAFADDLNTGIYSPSADQLGITTGGTVRLTTTTTGITSALPVDVPLGTASAPTVTFTGDLNTGIYSPGADQVAISTNGTGRLFVDSSGRVLVGTSSTSNVCTAVFAGNSASASGNGLVRLERNTTSPGVNDILGNLSFGTTGTSSTQAAGYILGERDGGTWTNGTSHPGRLIFATTADSANSPTERMRITSAGLVGIGTTTPESFGRFAVRGATTVATWGDTSAHFSDAATGSLYIVHGSNRVSLKTDSDLDLFCNNSGDSVIFSTNATERGRFDTSGRLLVGTSTAPKIDRFNNTALAHFATTSNTQYGIALETGSGITNHLTFKRSGGSIGGNTIVGSSDQLGQIDFRGCDGTDPLPAASIVATVDGTITSTSIAGRLSFHTTSPGAYNSPTERMRIGSAGHTWFNSSDFTTLYPGEGNTATGFFVEANGKVAISRDNTNPLVLNRKTSDGTIVDIRQDGTSEGTISVSGTTVSYNGAHLSRWSQLPSGQERTEILRGSVLSNIDEMCEWGEEDNEQLNRMKVSDVEGDKNVSGVFQAWDDDDDTYTDDFYCAMTGDFIIRIAEGVTVERGDLLMSAGDGTAKPQDDDIIRSKTIAKVTSTNVSCTYEDGSYCVPCVLMAC